MKSPTFEVMKHYNMPLTRGTWLILNGLTEDDADGEVEAMMPEEFQRWEMPELPEEC